MGEVTKTSIYIISIMPYYFVFLLTTALPHRIHEKWIQKKRNEEIASSQAAFFFIFSWFDVFCG
jgi:hypothetical protein